MKNALVVDDIETYTDTLEIYLEDKFSVFKAMDLNEALKIIRTHHIDLALVDIRLNEEDPRNKDGILLIKSLKKQHPDIAIMIMSAYKEFDYAVEALNAGADYFMRKPLQPDELEKVISQLIAAKE